MKMYSNVLKNIIETTLKKSFGNAFFKLNKNYPRTPNLFIFVFNVQISLGPNAINFT